MLQTLFAHCLRQSALYTGAYSDHLRPVWKMPGRKEPCENQGDGTAGCRWTFLVGEEPRDISVTCAFLFVCLFRVLCEDV